jgi:hypothetical protein
MKTLRPMFISLVLVLCLATTAWAERAVWVWSMADDIVFDSPSGSRSDFFTFCAAPHGDATKAITTVYLSGSVYDLDLVVDNAATLRNFLVAAHDEGLKVECLEGDKSWATPEGRSTGETRVDQIIAFNQGGTLDTQRFDGIHYDVEPYLLRYDEGDDYDWDADNAVIWSTYLAFLDTCQAKVDVYNLSHTDIKFGGAIPWWYDVDTQPGTPNDIQSRIDYIAIMDYRETGLNLVEGATNEIGNGNTLGKNVVIGVETAQAVPPDPETITFYEEGNTYMEEQLGYVATTFAGEASFDGFAIHYYEDVAAGEVAYRELWTSSFPGYQPIVTVTFPNGDEGVELVPGTTYNITWTTYDNDHSNNDLDIDIAYSSNRGRHYTTLSTGETNDGTYPWNTTGISDGDRYRVKVTATDPTALSGSDASDNNFTFESTPTPPPEWKSAQNTNVNGIRPVIVPDGDTLHMAWYWPDWGALPKRVYYKKSTDNGASWDPEVVIAEDATDEPRKPALAVRGNTVAIVWVESAGGTNGKQVKVRISADGGDTWDSEIAVSGAYTYYYLADFPDIAIDASDNIHVVWAARQATSPYRWLIHYNARISGVWESLTVVEMTDYYRSTPALTTDDDGVHVVWGVHWWAGTTLYTKISYRNRSGTWGTIRTVAQYVVTDGTWTKYFPDICSDSSNGKLHVVWQTAGDSPQTNATLASDVFYSSSTDSGTTWSTASNLADGYVPQVSYADGEVRVIYYVPGSTDELGDIRYRKSTNGGTSWVLEDIIATDARYPYWNAEVTMMVGFPSLASDAVGNMVAAWRWFEGIDKEWIVFSYKGKFNSPTDMHADLAYPATDAIRLRWQEPIGYTPNFYTLYRSINDGTYAQVATPIYAMVYDDTGLTGTNYYKYKVTATEGSTESPSSNVSNALYPGSNFMIDYFEAIEGITYSKIESDTSTVTYAYDTIDVHQGAQSQRLVYTYGGTGWGAVVKGTLPAKIDISQYDIAKLWVKGGVVSAKGIAIQFGEAGRPEGDEVWTSASPTIADNAWQAYEFYLSDFTRSSVEANDHFDTDSIGSYQLFLSENTSNGTYWVDQIELYKAPATLDVTPGSVAFGSVAPTVSNHRFQAPLITPPAINITYGGYNTPWTIRVWTDNSPGNGAEPEKAGLKGADGTTYIPMKVWCVNYGPAAHEMPPGPDEENDFFWGGYDFNGDIDKEDVLTSGTYVEATLGFDINGDGDTLDTIQPTPAQPLYEGPSWLRIPEKDEMDNGNRFTWRRLAWNDGLGSDAGLGGNFDSWLGIDIAGAVAQSYSTTVTIEYINQ